MWVRWLLLEVRIVIKKMKKVRIRALIVASIDQPTMGITHKTKCWCPRVRHSEVKRREVILEVQIEDNRPLGPGAETSSWIKDRDVQGVVEFTLALAHLGSKTARESPEPSHE
jgi:hypothetical protein